MNCSNRILNILLIFSFIINLTNCVPTFNNSVLQLDAWGLQDSCAPQPECPFDSNSDEDSANCEPMCDDSGFCTVTVGVILPKSQFYIVNLNDAVTVLKSAEIYGKEKNYLDDKINFTYRSFSDECSQEHATVGLINIAKSEKCTNVIFGPTCDYCLASITRVLKYIGDGGIPLFTPSGLTFDFTLNKTNPIHEMYMLINSGYTDYRSYAEFIHLLMHEFNWKKIVLMYEKDQQNEIAGTDSCKLFMSSIMEEIKQIDQIEYVDGDLLLLNLNYREFFETRVGTKYGLIFTCTNNINFRQIILEAQKLNMFDRGEYTFFNFELYNNGSKSSEPWYLENATEYENELAKSAFSSVYTFTPHEEYNFNDTIKGSHYLSAMYDSMLIYMQALNETLNELQANNTKIRHVYGCKLLHKIMGNTFYGGKDDEPLLMNCNAQRVTKFAMKTVTSSGDYETVAVYSILNKTITNWTVQWPFGVPLDTPSCGYDLSKCPTYDPVLILVICLIIAISLGAIVIGFMVYRHLTLKSEIYSMAWKIHYDDIIFFPKKPRRNSNTTIISLRSELIDNFSIAGDRQIFIPVGYYNSIKVAIKYLRKIKIDLNHQQLTELKIMKDLSNDNLVKFFGASLDIPNCVLTEYCPKGSLQDILENDQVKLDLTFRMSLIMDLVRGMHYLHSSPIKSHGALKSSNCLVDSRFVLKIADFGLHFLRQHYEHDEDYYNVNSHAYWKRQLWTAPELLRLEYFPPSGSQKGDVYSFAIVMHEILTRQGVFYLGDSDENFMDTKEIVDTVRKGPEANNGQPLRPLIGDTLNEEDVAQIMSKCWAEEAADRPDFSTLKNKLRQINKESDGNLLDNLLARMEQYANNLETLVEERTSDYLEEKRKCEELLYQLLPKSVAQQLITGESVIAETFDQVTIYFSDIVGFTELSAQSTPLQVVDLLNDLYTCFDSIIENFDVYKVETIGDAYMVVSGLPERNDNKHAREIARMSLALLNAVKKFQIRHRPKDPLQLRIGIHTGPCVAGVVGLKMPRYCLFGDTVNTASRMESNGHPLRIHVSPVTKAVLDTFETFDLECRGEVEMKGKGKMVTYWLNGERKLKSPTKTNTNSIPINTQTTTQNSNTHTEMSSNNSNGASLNVISSPHHSGDDSEIPLLSITSPPDYHYHSNA